MDQDIPLLERSNQGPAGCHSLGLHRRNLQSRAQESRRQRHVLMLAVSSAIVLLAFGMQVVPGGERVAFVGLANYPLPHTCLSRTLFGTRCPGCGLTRSMIFLAHGDWRSSWEMHHLGWLMALAVLLQFPYRLASLAHSDREILGIVAPKVFGYALIALLLGNWLVGLFL